MDQPSHDETRIARLQQYLGALEQAAQAIEQARSLQPHHGLDHAIDRLRALLYDGAVELQALLDAPGAMPFERR